MVRLFSPELPHDDPHYAAVGHATALWGMLEHTIDAAITELAELDREWDNSEAIACLTAQMISVHARLDALIALAHLREISPELIKELNSFSNELRPLSMKRNRLVHDPLVRKPVGDGEVFQLKTTTKGPKGSLEWGYYPFRSKTAKSSATMLGRSDQSSLFFGRASLLI